MKLFKKMEQIKKETKRFSEYSSSTMANVNFTINKQIYSSYSKNLHYMRGNFMMNMFISQQNSDFFDIPSAPSLFQSVYMKVSSMLVNYPAMFIQNLTAKIQKIYESPFEFAATVDLFFQEDMTDIIVFAYSSFPALYSFFLTDEFCSSASLFLSAIFKSSRNQLLSELLLSSFFISGTVFYDRFFSLIGDHLFDLASRKKNDFSLLPNNNTSNNQNNGKKRSFSFTKLFEPKIKLSINTTTNTTNNNNNNTNFKNLFDEFFPLFLQSLKICLPLLSQYHIQAFKNFCKTFPESSHKFFLQKVILQPFQTASESSISLVSSEGNKFFMSFLNMLSNLPVNDKRIQSFLTIVMNLSSSCKDNNNNNKDIINNASNSDNKAKLYDFHDVYPSLKGFVWNHGVPILFGHIDIKLLIDILKFTEIFNMDSSKINQLKINFKDSFGTVMFNVFPCFCATNPPEQGIGIELFGEAPPSFESSVRIYKDLIEEQKCKENINNDDDEEEEYSEGEKKAKDFEKNLGITSEKKRIFRKVNKFAIEENISLSELILNPPPQFSILKNDVSYIFLLLNKFHENFTTTEQAILMEEAKQKIKNLIISTQNMTHITYHHFSFSFLKERIHGISDIVPAIQELINSNSNTNSVANSNLLLTKSKVNPAFLSNNDLNNPTLSENRLPASVMFEISLTALDTLTLREGTKKIEMMEADFEDELMMWIEDEWPSFRENEIFIKRLKNIESLAIFLKHVQKGGYGSRLKIITNFVSGLRTILTTDNIHLWKPAFKYAVFFSSQKQVFSTFLYIYHFFIMQLRLDTIWDVEIQNLISMFTAGMWSILDKNIDLNLKYADFAKIKPIFYP